MWAVLIAVIIIILGVVYSIRTENLTRAEERRQMIANRKPIGTPDRPQRELTDAERERRARRSQAPSSARYDGHVNTHGV